MTDTLKSAQAAIAKYDEVQGKSLYQDEVAAFCDAANASIAAIREMSAEAVAALDASAPERIWLQVDTDGDNDDRSEPIPRESWDELTWHYEPIGGQEVEYVRVDLAHPAPKLPDAWQPIETAPSLCRILIGGGTVSWDGSPEREFSGVCLAEFSEDGWRSSFGTDDFLYHKPTHWQPLPPPPQEQGK